LADVQRDEDPRGMIPSYESPLLVNPRVLGDLDADLRRFEEITYYLTEEVLREQYDVMGKSLKVLISQCEEYFKMHSRL